MTEFHPLTALIRAIQRRTRGAARTSMLSKASCLNPGWTGSADRNSTAGSGAEKSQPGTLSNPPYDARA